MRRPGDGHACNGKRESWRRCFHSRALSRRSSGANGALSPVSAKDEPAGVMGVFPRRLGALLGTPRRFTVRAPSGLTVTPFELNPSHLSSIREGKSSAGFVDFVRLVSTGFRFCSRFSSVGGRAEG